MAHALPKVWADSGPIVSFRTVPVLLRAILTALFA
jgi:hypothetical protein